MVFLCRNSDQKFLYMGYTIPAFKGVGCEFDFKIKKRKEKNKKDDE